MKSIRRFLILAIVGVFSLLAVSATTSPLVQAPGHTPACTAAMKVSIEACPKATGCGEGGDAFLNGQKNRTDVPTSGIITKTLDQIRDIDQPSFWPTGKVRESIQEAGEEGTPVAVRAFLLKARAEGAESCNCGLTKRVDTDIHLVLVSKLPDMDDQEEVDEAENKSVTAEITPRVRRNGHAFWVHKNINDFEGEYIRVIGWLMLDTKHLRPTES